MSDWTNLAKRAVETLSPGDFGTLQAYVEDKSRLKINLEDGELDEVLTGRESGLALTAVDGRNTNFFCFAAPGQLERDLEDLPGLLDLPGGTSDLDWESPGEYEMDVGSRLDVTPTEAKKERVLEADRRARAVDDRVQQVRVTYAEKTRSIDVVDRAGWIRSENQQFVNFNVLVIAGEAGQRERGHSRIAGYQGPEIFEEKGPREVAEEAAEQAVTALEAEPVEPGPRTVVIGPGFGGTIFHEACGHGFEADHVYEDVSRYAGRMGETVASEKVTFVDEGAIDSLSGSFRIDDEGTPSRRNVLIKDGVMEGLMTDRKYADLLDIEPTGNGRRQSFNYPVLPRMTNTYIEAGDADPDSIVEDTEEGIYAAHIGGGQVDPASGDFIFSVTEGYRIENGEITTPIRDAALVGNGPDVLNRIDAVGDDLDLQPGICGKGQWVPVSVGQPTLRVRELTVGGQDS